MKPVFVNLFISFRMPNISSNSGVFVRITTQNTTGNVNVTISITLVAFVGPKINNSEYKIKQLIKITIKNIFCTHLKLPNVLRFLKNQFVL